MSNSRHILQRDKLASEVGLSGVTLASERTSSNIDVNGFSQMTIFVNLSAQTSATAVLVKPEVSNDEGTTWFPVQTQSVSSGTATLSDLVISKTVAAADTFMYDLPINYDLMRLKVSGTSGAAGDVVSVTVRLGTV